MNSSPTISPLRESNLTPAAASKLSLTQSVLFLVFVWYLTAVFSVTTSKTILNHKPYPHVLCLCQFMVAYYVSTTLANYHTTFKSVSEASMLLVISIGVTYSLGFILTNMAFSKASTSFAETVKASEPISSVIFGYIFYSESLTVNTYMALLLICIGVATSCMTSDAFNLVAFSLAIGSNIFFSARAVLSKVLVRSYPDVMNEISLFTYISLCGVLTVLPFTAILDAPIILMGDASNSSDGNISNISLGFLYICNGVAYTAYNLMSFMVLMRTNIATHAVLNVFRRVFIIVFTSVYFNNPLSDLNIFGIFLSILGVLLFNWFKGNVEGDKKGHSGA